MHTPVALAMTLLCTGAVGSADAGCVIGGHALLIGSRGCIFDHGDPRSNSKFCLGGSL